MSKFTLSQNREFWDKDAMKKKDSPIGAHSDPHIVELENQFILTKLSSIKPKTLLDIGCGNGQRTILFSKFSSKKTMGIDYSSKMIQQAKTLLSNQRQSVKNKIIFETGDIQKFNEKSKFDTIISCRCFINQTSYSNQVKLFKNLHGKLNKNGSLIIAEGSKEGYEYLNYLRKKFGLTPIKISWYNLPIKESFVLEKIKKLFRIEKINRLGQYYYISRVLHPALVSPKVPNPNSKINDLAMKTELIMSSKLSPNDSFERTGSHLLIHFKKISS